MASSKTLLINEESLENNCLQCSVCAGKYGSTHRIPKMLPCSHTFCDSCLIQITRNSGDSRQLKCPECRAKHTMTKREISQLPTNRCVLQMINFICKASSNSINMCLEHPGQPLYHFCRTCSVPICTACTAVVHPPHDGHKIDEISDVLRENSEQIPDIEKKSSESLRKMNGRLSHLNDGLRRLESLRTTVKQNITDKFNSYKCVMDRRIDALCGEVDTFFNEQKQKVTAHQSNLLENITRLQELCEEFESSKNDKDVHKVLTITQKMKNHKSEFKSFEEENDTYPLQSCILHLDGESFILSQLEELGEIQEHHDYMLNWITRLCTEKPFPLNPFAGAEIISDPFRQTQRRTSEQIQRFGYHPNTSYSGCSQTVLNDVSDYSEPSSDDSD